jgi:hypothetical protein
LIAGSIGWGLLSSDTTRLFDAGLGEWDQAVCARTLELPPITSVSWIGAINGDWSTRADWSTGKVPGKSSDVTISASGAYTVTISAAESAHSITIDDAGVIVSASNTLDLGATLALIAGTFELEDGAQISGGTVSVAADADFQGDGGTLSGVKFHGTLDLGVGDWPEGPLLTIVGKTTFAGINGVGSAIINIAGGFETSGYLDIEGNYTLSNATVNLGSVQHESAGYLSNYDPSGTGATLTLGASLVINNIGIGSIISSDNANDEIINDGTITAAYNGGLLYIDATRFINKGLISVSNGDAIDLQGNITAALFDSIENSGGLIIIGGDINGGTLMAPNGGVDCQGGTLTNVSYQGTLDIAVGVWPNYPELTINGKTKFSDAGGVGAATINIAGNFETSGFLNATGNYTLSNATINLGSLQRESAGYLMNLDSAGTGATLTLASNLVIDNIGVGYIASSDAPGDEIINEGTINAAYNGGILYIDATSFVNRGVISVSNGGMIGLYGSIAPALINGISNLGGLVLIDGNVNGGTIMAPNGGVGGGGGTLTNVNYQGTLDLTANLWPNGPALTLVGTTKFSGAGGVGTATIYIAGQSETSGFLYVEGNQTLNNATINIGSNAFLSSAHLTNYDPSGTGATLTLGSNLTINNVGSSFLDSSGYTGDLIINVGTIIVGDGVLNIDANFENKGNLSVTSISSNGTTTYGTLVFGGYNIINSGTIDVASGTTVVDGNVTGGGAFDISSGGVLQVTPLFTAAVVGDGSAILEFTSGGSATLNQATTGVTVVLDAATNLTLSKMSFVTAVGEVSGNTIKAGAINQTVGGTSGGDTLVGYSGFGDTFLGTTAGLNGDTIHDFGGMGSYTDVIDVTNLSPSASLTYTGDTTRGILTLNDGSNSTTMTLFGDYNQSNFQIETDGHNGSFITYT